jgi:hypothetical protein
MNEGGYFTLWEKRSLSYIESLKAVIRVEGEQ